MYGKDILTSAVVVFKLPSEIIFKKSICLNASYNHCSKITEGAFTPEADLREESHRSKKNDIEALW